MPVPIPIYHVDAFTDRPFAGNPAGVCVLDEEKEDAWLQSVAREMNLSETAFLERATGCWKLRWFTPAVEVDLCGHATLASAHVLWETGRVGPASRIDFQTRSGRLSAFRRDGSIELDFPAEPASAGSAPPDLLEAMGIDDVNFTGRNRLDYLIEISDETRVRALAPDFPRLARAGGPSRGVIVTARSDDPRYDFVSRFFAPAVGIDEDPVTGSAHCCLGPYWAEKLGRSELRGFQASSRGGTVGVRIAPPRVFLAGGAVLVTRGELV